MKEHKRSKTKFFASLSQITVWSSLKHRICPRHRGPIRCVEEEGVKPIRSMPPQAVEICPLLPLGYNKITANISSYLKQ